MTQLAAFVICLSVAASAILAARVPDKGAAHPFLIWVVLLCVVSMAVSFVLRKDAVRRAAEGEPKGGGEPTIDAKDLDANSAALQAACEALLAEMKVEGPDALRGLKATVAELQRERVDPVVDAKDSLMLELGIARFAEFMSTFARGERSMNRAWSALTDGHLQAARAAVAAAGRAFAAAKA